MDKVEEEEETPAVKNTEDDEDAFVKKWAGAVLLGPFIPAVFALFTIVIGSIVLTTWKGKCGYPLQNFIQAAVVLSYFFLIVYSWVFLGDTIYFEIPFAKRKITLLSPFSSLKWVIGMYSLLAIISFIVWIVGSVFVQFSTFCITTAPLLYSFSLFLVIIYWIGFSVSAVIVIKMKYGNQILAVVNDQIRAPSQEELEEQIFLKKFNEYDKEKVGSLPKDKLPEFLLDLGVYIPDEEMPALIEKLDSKGNGLIIFNKLQAWFKQVNAAANDVPAEMDLPVDSSNTKDRTKKAK